MVERQGDIKFDVAWTTLARVSGTPRAARRLVQCRFVRRRHDGAHPRAGLRRPPRRPPAELDQMRELVREAMREGALGVGSSLIYAPAFYADTHGADRAVQSGGRISRHVHLAHAQRGQPAARGGRRADPDRPRGQAAGRDLSPQGGRPGELAEAARKSSSWSRRPAPRGTRITADMYIYTAGSTGLNALDAPLGAGRGLAEVDRADARSRDSPAAWPTKCARRPTSGKTCCWPPARPSACCWSASRIQALKHLTGKTLAEVASRRGTSPEETAMDLVIEDDSRVRHGLLHDGRGGREAEHRPALGQLRLRRRLDAPEGPFLLSQPHPRTYGNVARLLGKYVRDEKVIPLEEAIRKLTGLPADESGSGRSRLAARGLFCRRGRLRSGQDPGPRHLRPPAPIRHRHAPRPRQRHAGAGRRRAHRRQAGPSGVGPRPASASGGEVDPAKSTSRQA